MLDEKAILDFTRSTLRSVWALELLLFLKQDAARMWDQRTLIRELRSSEVVVAEGVANLLAAGLVVVNEAGKIRYAPAAPSLNELVDGIEHLYATKPVTVINEIVNSSSNSLRALSEAFRVKR